ncbi:MAG: protein BatD [Rhodopirellula sp.]|nr:protein BatD [Rhodopirellula sp.]
MDRRREQVDEHQKAGGFSPARFEIERGPVRVIVEASPAKARLSDQITLTLRIEAAAGVQVRKPNLKGSIGDFVIRDFRQPLPRVDEDREIFERVYALEPTKTGTLSIPPLRIAFTDPRGQNGEAESVLETEPFRIEIESVVASETPSLADLRPLAPPVPVPAQRTPSLWWSLVPLGAVLAAVVWLIRRRQRRMVEAAPLSPRELARDELERLLGRDLAETDVKQFYTELTGIVRRYIERSTQVRAPEQTTEEFLHEIAEKETFSADESQRLRQFLESADLVKFAAYRPRGEDIDESIRRARHFLGLDSVEAAV